MANSPKTILLVEDEAIIALQETRQLEKAGYGVILSSTGEESIALVEANPSGIDLILMDIDLGEGMDGTEAAQRILETNDIPILFLSSHMETAIVRKTEEITNYGYVVKSSVFTVLDASIKMALKLFSAKRQLDLDSLEIETKNEELRASLAALRKTHEDLALSEDKFSKAFYVNPDSININRLSDGVYVDVNLGFTLMTGYTREDVIGRSSLPGDLGIWVREEDRERLVRELIEIGEVANLEADFRRKDGEVITGLMSAHIIEVDGERCLISITRDITERKLIEERLRESEERFRLAMEASSDGIWDRHVGTEVVYYSPAYYSMLGYEAKEFHDVGYEWTDHVHPDDLVFVLGKNTDCVENRCEGFDIEFRMKTKDGSWKWIRSRGKAVGRGPGGRAIRLIGTHIDIADRIKAETALRDGEGELKVDGALKELIRNKETLMKELEHRVKNSLSIISSLIGFAMAETIDEKALSILKDTGSRIKSISAIYERLYDSGRVESIDFGVYLESLAKSILDTYNKPGTELKLEIRVCHIEIDAKTAIALGLIVNELMTNSIKHALGDANVGMIAVRLERRGEGAILKVSDDGIGISAGDALMKPKSMGMMLIKELSNQIGATLDIDSGKGTTVSIVFGPVST
jgi:PAS domain S-box-containing protein